MTVYDLMDHVLEHGPHSLEDLGSIRVTSNGTGLWLACYKREAYETWNDAERLCRGIIYDEMGTLHARPFDKFFNLGEPACRVREDDPIVAVCEKVDGSMGTVYIDPADDRCKVATKGSFNSEQALRATAMLDRYPALEDEARRGYTTIVEIIYPENRVVIDYGDTEELRWLACRHTKGGTYKTYPLRKGLPSPVGWYRMKTFAEVRGAAEALPASAEGYVAVTASGERVKIKGPAYVAAHRARSQLSPRRIAELYLAEGEAYVRSLLDDEPDLVNRVLFDVELERGRCESGAAWLLNRFGREDRKALALGVKSLDASLIPLVMAQAYGGEADAWMRRRLVGVVE